MCFLKTSFPINLINDYYITDDHDPKLSYVVYENLDVVVVMLKIVLVYHFERCALPLRMINGARTEPSAATVSTTVTDSRFVSDGDCTASSSLAIVIMYCWPPTPIRIPVSSILYRSPGCIAYSSIARFRAAKCLS